MKDIQTKKVKVINKETLIVTIDINKVTNVGYCRCPNGIDVKPFGFLNNGQGFKSFWDRITQQKFYFPHDMYEGGCSFGYCWILFRIISSS